MYLYRQGKIRSVAVLPIARYKPIGVEIHLSQSVSRPCWIILIINPSSLLAGTYEPTALFQANEQSVQQVKHRLRNILDKIGVDRRLKEFKLSRCDLTCNLYYKRRNDVLERVNVLKKAYLIPHYRVILFGKYANSDVKFEKADKYSWTFENH